MHVPSEFATVYCCFEDVETVGKMLPTVLRASERSGAAVVVVDSSVRNRAAMGALLAELGRGKSFFLAHTDPISMGLARNLGLWLALELHAPTYLCMLEDDHGYADDTIPQLIQAMQTYYGKPSATGLRFGMFTTCPYCWGDEYLHNLVAVDGGPHLMADTARVPPLMAGGTNSCFRCAPTTHWLSVLKGYDTDEYPISTFQTAGLNLRNYHKGYATLVVGGGRLCVRHDREGRGFTTERGNRPFHEQFSRRDPRSGFGPVPERTADDSGGD